MFFSGKRPESPSAQWKPFVLRTRDGYLVGVAMDREQGSPCVECVQGWLEKRGMGSQPGKLDELPLGKDSLAQVLADSSPHVLHEIHHDGTIQRLKSTVFPLPGCGCAKGRFQAPAGSDPVANYSFSPITQIKCVRYVTPSGHLWLTSAAGTTPLKRQPLTVFGAGSSKGASRAKAIDNWLKQAAVSDLQARTSGGEIVPLEILQTGNADTLGSQRPGPQWEAMGAGDDFEQATLDALYSVTRQKTLKGYSNSGKNPMLVVGANNWLRQRVPFFLLQEYDLHLLFYPNASPCWVVGLAAFSRIKSDAKPVFIFHSAADITEALEGTLAKLMEWTRPEAGETPVVCAPEAGFSDKGFKLNLWWTHWIYRCSKITLKDVLHLEAYPKSVEFWRDYVRDGQAPVQVVPLNHPDLPMGIRALVAVRQLKEETASGPRVVGIGTLSHFQQTVL